MEQKADDFHIAILTRHVKGCRSIHQVVGVHIHLAVLKQQEDDFHTTILTRNPKG
jgi:hypothetical protein